MIKKIKDYIQSFFYYFKMVRWFQSHNMEQYDIWHSALRYAWWHCRVGKMSDCTNEPLNNILEKNVWKSIYRQKPIGRTR